METQKKKEILFHSDQAIKSWKNDELGRKEFAWRIADVLAKRDDSDSLVIGIDAPWGEGKTSVLNMIVERLKKEAPDASRTLLGGNILTIKFNPWRFSDEQELLKNFYDILADKLGTSLETTLEKLSKFAKGKEKYAQLLDKLQINLPGDISINYKVSEAVKSISEFKSDIDLEEQKDKLGKILRDANYKIVIIMDDIDRLNKEEMHTVFRLVKLSADIPKVSYILSFDGDKVALALSDKYGSPEAGKAFLEKIIQVHLLLPPVSSQRLLPLAIKGIKAALEISEIALSEGELRIFQDLFYRAFEWRITNPRLSNRLTNSLSFALPLIKGELNTLDFILIESIKVYYPKLYEEIKNNILLFTPPTSWQRAFDFDERRDTRKPELTSLIENFLNEIPNRHQKGISELIQYMFPKTKDILNAYDRFRENYPRIDMKKRISMEEYFPKYFTYSVEPNDVSDNETIAFLNSIKDSEISGISKKIVDFVCISDEMAMAFFRKISYFSDNLEPESKQTLAMALSLGADSFLDSHPDTKFYGLGTLIQAVNLTFSLIQGLPEDKKSEISLSIVEQTPSTMFAFDFMRFVKPTESGKSFLPDIIYSNLKDRVLAKIKKDAREQTLERRFEIYAQELYLFWYENDLDSLQRYISHRINSNPAEITSFLAGIYRVSLSPENPYLCTIWRGGDYYKITTDIIELNAILDAIKKTFGHNDSEGFDESFLDQKMAKTFIDVHNQRTNSSNSEDL